MGSRDYRRREAKKPKKGAKKLSPLTIMLPQETVEVIKKGKKEPVGPSQEGPVE